LEEMSGHTAYSRLLNAGVVADPVCAEVADARQFFATSLQTLSQASPGQLRNQLGAALDAEQLKHIEGCKFSSTSAHFLGRPTRLWWLCRGWHQTVSTLTTETCFSVVGRHGEIWRSSCVMRPTCNQVDFARLLRICADTCGLLYFAGSKA
jgi:hypothetical protein